MFDPLKKQWIEAGSDLNNSTLVDWEGFIIPVTPAHLLYEYKQILAGWGQAHQLEDVRFLERYLSKNTKKFD